MFRSSSSRKASPAASLYFRLGRKRKPSALKSTNFSTTLVETKNSGEEEIEMGEARGGEEQLYEGLSRISDEESAQKPLTSLGPARSPLRSPMKSPRPKWVDLLESVSRVPSRQEDPKYTVDSPRSPRDHEISPMPPIAELQPRVSNPKPESPAPTKNYQDLLAARERAYSNETLRRQAETHKAQQESHTPQVSKKREEWMRSGSARGPRYKDVLDVVPRPRAPSTQSTREVSQLVQEAIRAAPPMPPMSVGVDEEERPPPVRKDSKYQKKKRPADLQISERR